MLSSGTIIKVIGQKEVEAKLLAAAPRILEQNRLMVTAMLDQIKPIVESQTPLGPGHFGYHARDRFRIKVKAVGIKTVGELLGATQSYWREFGTGIRFRGPKRNQAVRVMTGMATGGEPARMTAHKAASLVKRFINAYYGMAAWWRA